MHGFIALLLIPDSIRCLLRVTEKRYPYVVSFRGYALRVERDVLEQRQVVCHLLWTVIHPSQICSGMTKEQNLQIRNKTIITYCVGAQHVVRSLSFGWLCVKEWLR